MDGTRFWAVIVGIDHHEHDSTVDLRGACSDAALFHDYCTQSLSVPSDHIRLLVSETAGRLDAEYPTRQGILSALYSLRNDPRIQRDDNIIFYFAGRGARYHLPRKSTGSPYPLDALCPADRGYGPAGEFVMDISDLEIRHLLHDLNEAKGNNITIILDASYPERGIRIGDDGYHRCIRTAPSLNMTVKQMMEYLAEHAHFQDAEAGGSNFMKAWEVVGECGDWDERSCVLLLACLPVESALETRINSEVEWHGCFTRALVRLLQVGGKRTFAELGEAVKEYIPHRYMFGSGPIQTPYAAGARKDEQVWFSKEDRTEG